MSRTDMERWDARYRDGAYESRRHPSNLLAHWLERLEFTNPHPRAVDIACGAGRNTLFLARLGWEVDAIDISPVALARLNEAAEAERLRVNCVERDLIPTSTALAGFEDRQYDLAVMTRYADTALVKALARMIAPGGYVIAEMHLKTDATVSGPRSPRFRVEPDALRQAGASLDLLHYHEGLVTDPDGRTVALAQLVGRRVKAGTVAPSAAQAR